jgi:hypothetical protein
MNFKESLALLKLISSQEDDFEDGMGAKAQDLLNEYYDSRDNKVAAQLALCWDVEDLLEEFGYPYEKSEDPEKYRKEEA